MKEGLFFQKKSYLFLLEHGKLHAQTSTLWTLCAALTEA